MIRNPLLLLFTLGAIVFIVNHYSKSPHAQGLFKYLPVPLWCYFIPTLLSTFGLLPSDSPLYTQISRFILPACLFLLLIGSDLRSIFRLGPKSLYAMIIGAGGIFLGALMTFIFIMQLHSSESLQDFSDLWRGWGCLTATWIGGSANMLSVKEILQTPESLFSNLIIVDTIVAYSWMALLVSLSKFQNSIDRWLGIDPHWNITENFSESKTETWSKLFPLSVTSRLGAVLLAFAVGSLCWFLAPLIQHWTADVVRSLFDQFTDAVNHNVMKAIFQLKYVMNRMTWTVILATFIPLILSLTPAIEMGKYGTLQSGNMLLYLMLTSFGARANLASLVTAPIYLAMGIVWIVIHGVILITLGKVFRIPISLLATASQANVGGTVSAPLVGSVYHEKLASIGVILAVTGNIGGTFLGLLLSEICRRLMDLL